MDSIEEQAIRFRSDGLAISARAALAGDPGDSAGAILCHPHPAYGGNMDNNVIVGIAAVLKRAGVSTLCFDFRGVGMSEGGYSGGEGEREDARAAVRALKEMQAGKWKALAMVGYSFGAWAGCGAVLDDPSVDCLVAISPPLTLFDCEAIAACEKPTLLVCGNADHYCPASDLEKMAERHAGSCSFEVVQGADHFWLDREDVLGRLVVDYVEGTCSV